MPHQNHFTAFVVILLFPLSCALFSPKISLAQTYSQSVIAAQNNIDNNTGFIPNFPGSGNKKIITIQGTPALEDPNFGLHYETYGATPYLVTRTFAKSRNFYNSATQALTPLGSYTTYAPASPAATWVTTGNDGTKFLDGQGATSATVTDILERGLGMNNDASHDIIIEIGVLPNTDNIMRPARAYGISTYSTTASDYAFDANFDNIAPAGQMTNLKAYLTAWQKDALGSTTDPKWHGLTAVNPSPFPWTESGYTYYWNSGGTDLNYVQGMSEFVILGGTAVKLVGYYSTQSYLYTKNKGGVFSSDSDAEYGNGFASFNITGNCDTVWAGNGFQKNVSASAAPGSENTITVANTGNVSGGQGLLVWSTNYKVTNNGTISGATKNKLYYSAAYPGINNTANIGVLFLGNADDAGGSNQLINAGTISSPGIAIEADAGDTVITNTGTISGGTYSILTYGGADHVDLNSGDVTGSIDLGTGAAVDQLDLGVTGNLKLHFALDRDTRTSAQVFNAENVTFTNNRVTLAVTQAEDSKNIHNNDSFLIVDANTALTADITKIAVEADSTLPMITFSLSKIANKLYIDSVRDTVYYQDNSGNASLGQALDTLASSSTNDMAFILGALDDTGNATNAQKLEPVAAAPVVNAAIETLNNFGNVFSLQMARLNNDGPDPQVYVLNNGKRKRVSSSVMDNLLAYNSDSILENSFYRPEKLEVFATGFGVMGFQSDRNNSTGYESGGGGTQAGFYSRINDELMLGLLGGYMFDNVRLNQDSGSQDINSVRIGPCAKWLRKDLYATTALTYGYHAVQAERKINFGVINRQADSDYSMHDISPYMEAGYILHPKINLEVVPYVSMQYDWLHSQSYNESGAGAADLSVKASDSNSLVSVLGMRFNGRIELKNIALLPEFNIGWQHEYLGRLGDVSASFSSESGGTFITSANAFDRNALRLGVGTNFLYGKKQNAISLQYNAQVYDSASNHVFSITCRNYF